MHYNQVLECNRNYNVSIYHYPRANSQQTIDGFLLNSSVLNRRSDLFKRAKQQTVLSFCKRESYFRESKIEQSSDCTQEIDNLIKKLARHHKRFKKKGNNQNKVITIRTECEYKQPVNSTEKVKEVIEKRKSLLECKDEYLNCNLLNQIYK